MAKDTFYFSHDFNARNDRKLIKVKLKYRQSGIGIFWSIIEMLFEEGGALPISEIPTIAGDLREKESTVLSIINDFELFENNGNVFWSNSAKRRIDKRLEKSEKARESIRKRWENTNVLQSKNDSNTIKERKGKERKESIEKKSAPSLENSNLFRKPVIPTLKQVEEVFMRNGGTKEMAQKFFNKHESVQWFLNGSPIVNFSGLVSGFIENWKKYTPESEKKKVVVI